MKDTLSKTTPRAFSLLFILAAIPGLYFIDRMIECAYNDPLFVANHNRFYKYYYLYNIAFFACGLALTRFNFHSPSAQYTLVNKKMISALFPLVFSFIGLMIPETDSKHMIWPALFTQITTTTVESIMANKGLLPFWFYSYRHYIGLAYIVMFITNFVAMRRLHKRRQTHSAEFVDIIDQ